MSLFVLDTDHLTLDYHGDPIVVQRVETRPPTESAISVLSIDEQLTGRYTLTRLEWTPNTVALDRGVFVNTLPHFNRGYGNDTRPDGPSSPRIRHAGAEYAFAFAVGRHTGDIPK
jgi:hypothetical protein